MFSWGYSILGNHLSCKVYLKYRSLFYHIKIEVAVVSSYLANGGLWKPTKKIQRDALVMLLKFIKKWFGAGGQCLNWDAHASLC